MKTATVTINLDKIHINRSITFAEKDESSALMGMLRAELNAKIGWVEKKYLKHKDDLWLAREVVKRENEYHNNLVAEFATLESAAKDFPAQLRHREIEGILGFDTHVRWISLTEFDREAKLSPAQGGLLYCTPK